MPEPDAAVEAEGRADEAARRLHIALRRAGVPASQIARVDIEFRPATS